MQSLDGDAPTVHRIMSQLPEELRLHPHYSLEMEDPKGRMWGGASLKHHTGYVLLTMVLHEDTLMVHGTFQPSRTYHISDPQLLDHLQQSCDLVIDEHQSWWCHVAPRRSTN